MFVEFRLDTDMTRAMQDVRDKIALVRSSFPRDVKDPLVIRADNENSAAGGVAGGDVADASACASSRSLTDQTIVKGLESVAGRGAGSTSTDA